MKDLRNKKIFSKNHQLKKHVFSSIKQSKNINAVNFQKNN